MENNKCPSCDNLGRVSIKLDENCAPFSFRCHCRHGEVKYPAWPMFSPESIGNALGRNKNLTSRKPDYSFNKKTGEL